MNREPILFSNKNNLLHYQFTGGQFEMAQGVSLPWRMGVSLNWY